MLKDELAKASVRQLRDIARDVGITMPQKLRKEELIDQITERMQQQGTSDLPEIVPMKKRGKKSKSELEAMAAQQDEDEEEAALDAASISSAPAAPSVQTPSAQPFGMDVFGKDVFGQDVFAAPQKPVQSAYAQPPVQSAPPKRYESRMPETRPAPPAGDGQMRVTSVYTAPAPRTPYGQRPDARTGGMERTERPRTGFRTPMRPKYQDVPARPAQPAWETPAPPKTGEDDYAVMSQRYGDTLALHRAQKSEQESEDMTFSVPNTEQDVFDTQPQSLEEACGVLEILPDGYGFLRVKNYYPGAGDVYVSLQLIRKYSLRAGDMVQGKSAATRPREKRSALVNVESVNGKAVAEDMPITSPFFDKMTPVYPTERIRLEDGADGDISLRLIDLVSPIGKGQRALVVAPPKAGKTVLLKHMAQSIKWANPDMHVIMLLIDERPEEVTDMQRSIDGEVVYSTFDEQPERHVRVAELLLERAKRMVEAGQDVVILLDSITRLARAYNLTTNSGGKTLSGGLDSAALYRPKWFFGAARKLEEGASLTIIATALVDTGSRLDEMIYEEFKGTGNMEVFLDRKLSQKRIFPALDLLQSGTRREDLLLDEEERAFVQDVRRVLSGAGDATESLIEMMEKTSDNRQFIKRFYDWQQLLTEPMKK